MDTVNYASWSRDDLISRILELEQPHVHPQNSNINSSTSQSNHTPQNPSKAPKRQYDFSKTSCRPIALKLAYLGHDYHGFAGSDNDIYESIETHLFHALRTTKLIPDRASCNYSRCGRTDKGVSAFDQVVGLFARSSFKAGLRDQDGVVGGTYKWEQVRHVSDRFTSKNQDGDEASSSNRHSSSRDNLSSISVANNSTGTEKIASSASVAPPSPTEIDYPAIINKLLPPTIRILAWSPVAPTFSARFDCTSRSYRYYFLANTLTIPKMKSAASVFKGAHDSSNFCKVDPSRDVNHTRVIQDAAICSIDEFDEYLSNPTIFRDDRRTYTPTTTTIMIFYIKGRAFLWHQVRCMMAILFLIGQELEPVSLVADLLNDADVTKGRPCYDLAPEHPLVLAECEFPEGMIHWIYATNVSSNQHQETVISPIYSLYTESLIKTSMMEYLLQCATLSSKRKEVKVMNMFAERDLASQAKTYTPVLMRPRAESQQSKRGRVVTNGDSASMSKLQ